MLRMDNRGQEGGNPLVAGILGVYIALTIVFALNTESFDAVTLSLWLIVGLAIVGAFLGRLF